jgi:hypothetical protein
LAGGRLSKAAGLLILLTLLASIVATAILYLIK